MIFDKIQYWKNRNEGKRGQGGKGLIVEYWSDGPNRAQKRHKSVNHLFTRKGYDHGRQVGQTSSETIAARVKRKEMGERERIAKKRDEELTKLIARAI